MVRPFHSYINRPDAAKPESPPEPWRCGDGPFQAPTAAVRDSDIVALSSHAGEPIIQPDWIQPGTHVSSVGYKPPSGELPRGLLERGSLFVETRLAFEPTPVGCAELDGLDPASATELGEVVAGTRSGRVRRDEITIYKAMGHVIEDMVAADIAIRAARRDGVGQMLRM